MTTTGAATDIREGHVWGPSDANTAHIARRPTREVFEATLSLGDTSVTER